MKLLENKIYRAYTFTSGSPLPTLEIKGAPKIYISCSDLEPKSVSEMTDVTDETKPGVNLLNGQIRYIAYRSTTSGDSVSECGIVTKGIQG